MERLINEEHRRKDSKLSSKILSLAQAQVKELSNNEDSSSIVSEEPDLKDFDDFDDVNNVYKELDITEEDQNTMKKFFNTDETKTSRTLGDIIMEKMKQKEAEQALNMNAEPSINPAVVEVYSQVGTIMKRYRSGRVPKALKVIPSLQNWEEILEICEVYDFSNQAIFVLTRLLASNLNERHAQIYYTNFLLPIVRENIRNSVQKTLNCHLYNALKKALYKPAAFFKGIVIPIIEDSSTTLKEAAIVASVLNSSSVPMLHSAAAVLSILKTCDANKFYSFNAIAPGMVLLKILINKKYNFPQRVIDDLVIFFYGFNKDMKEPLPVLWHQTLLVFVQRYKTSLTKEQREALKVILRKHNHPKLTPEIRRELLIHN